MVKASNYAGAGNVKKRYTKQISFVAALLAMLTLFGGCGNQEPSDTANKSAPDAKVTATGASSAAETPVVLTEAQEIEKILTDQSPSNTP